MTLEGLDKHSSPSTSDRLQTFSLHLSKHASLFRHFQAFVLVSETRQPPKRSPPPPQVHLPSGWCCWELWHSPPFLLSHFMSLHVLTEQPFPQSSETFVSVDVYLVGLSLLAYCPGCRNSNYSKLLFCKSYYPPLISCSVLPIEQPASALFSCPYVRNCPTLLLLSPKNTNTNAVNDAAGNLSRPHTPCVFWWGETRRLGETADFMIMIEEENGGWWRKTKQCHALLLNKGAL